MFSTAYALMNQHFTISGTATIFNYGDCPADISYDYEIVSSWGNSSSGYTYHVNFSVINNSNSAINTWTIVLKGPSDLRVSNANATTTVDQGEIRMTPTGNYSWAANIAAGSSRDIDFQRTPAGSTLNLEYLYFNNCMAITGGGGSPLRDFSLTPEQVTLHINEIATIEIHKMPVDAQADFAFFSDDDTVATVNASGVITGVSRGSTMVHVSHGGTTKSVSVTVTNQQVTLTSISLSPKNNQMKVGDIKTLTTTRVPANAGGTTTYTSSNPSVATVDSGGRVTAISAGSTVITVSSSGLSDTANVTVIREASSEDLDITFSNGYYYDRDLQFTINFTNIGQSEIRKITFSISFPSGTTWSYWNNYPAQFVANNTGTRLTSTGSSLLLTSGSYITFTGNVTLPRGYSSSNYLQPTIYDVEVE